MNQKPFEISGSGLRNIVFTTDIEEDKFRFIVGEKEIEIRRIFADFISPYVSQIHQSDPTINFLCLNDFVTKQKQNQISDIITLDLIENIKQLVNGYSIEVDEKMCHKLRFFSILIGNEEIFRKMNELYPLNSENAKINDYLQYLELIDFKKAPFIHFQDNQIFDYLSGQFHSIDENRLLHLPKPILYSIISNDKLKVKSEDSLFDFINKLFLNEDDDDDQFYNIILFYEQLNISSLSERKFNEFIENLDPNKISRLLWEKLKECFNFQPKEKNVKTIEKKDVENSISIEYDNNPSNKFKGIITYLGQGNPKSVIDKKIVDITSSSVVNNSEYNQPFNAIEYNTENYFYSSDNSKDDNGHPWLCFDFKQQKVRPSHYSVKSIARNNNDFNISNWNIEGSNDGNSWKILDSRRNEKSLDGSNASATFPIQNNLDKNEFYRYLRIHNIGPNVNETHQLIIKSIEFFGQIQKS